MLQAILSLALLASSSVAKILYAGVAESGGEFGVWSATSTPGTGLPGRFGVDYAFINKSTVDVFVAKDKVCSSPLFRKKKAFSYRFRLD